MKALATLLLLPLGTFQNPTFEVRGVCAIDATAVACWAPDGGPKPGLADEVRRGIEARGLDLSIVRGRKNRFVILRHTSLGALDLGGEWRLRFYPLDLQGTPQTSLLRVVAPLDAATANVKLTLTRKEGSPVTVPFREAAKATVDGVPVEIGRIGENPGDWNGFASGYSGAGPWIGGRWRFPLDVGETTPGGGFRIEALGHDGKPVLYVDPKGLPLEAKRGEALWREAMTSGRPLSAVPAASPVEVAFWNRLPIGWVDLNVDPKAIRALRMRRIVQRREPLGPLALDPNP